MQISAVRPVVRERYEPLTIFVASTVAALGGFLFGYDTCIISGALHFLQKSFALSTMMQEFVVSIVILGALVGAVSSGRLTDKFGSQRMLLWIAFTFVAGTVLSSFAANIMMLLIGRFLTGIAIGITSYVSPLFISEMAPKKFRGSLVLLNGIMITGGECAAFLVDYYLVPTGSWRLMFATGLIPALFLLLGMLFLPATPRFLIRQGKIQEAFNLLNRIRKSDDVAAEFKDMVMFKEVKSKSWQELFSPTVRSVLIIGLGLGILQQFAGINTIMYYGPTIFKAMGFKGESTQLLATFGMGLVNTIMTLVTIVLVDRVGRRVLLMIGLAAASLSLVVVGTIFYFKWQTPLAVWSIISCFVVFIIGFTLSLGSLFWLIIAEIYPQNIRGLAMSLVTATQWAANFLVSLTFLSMMQIFGESGTFWLYGIMCIIALIFCYYLVPETRRVSLEQIEANLRAGKTYRQLTT